MGVDINDLLVGEADVEVEWQGNTVHVTYNPNAYTPEVEAEWAKMEKESNFSGPLLTDFVVRLVVKWDVLGDWEPNDPEKSDGEGKFVTKKTMFPIIHEKVAKLPIMFLGDIVGQITEDATEGR
jgi:hypothetical protein